MSNSSDVHYGIRMCIGGSSYDWWVQQRSQQRCWHCCLIGLRRRLQRALALGRTELCACMA
jgi:hypothetical protein